MSGGQKVNRRRFLGSSVVGAIGTGMVGWVKPEAAGRESVAETQRVKAYRRLGRTGFKVSDIAVGTGLASDPSVISGLLDAGVNYIDTGESYGNGRAEKNIGQVIKKRDRKSLFVTTKLKLSKSNSKADIIDRTSRCLERLQTDYIDCVMIHSAPDTQTLTTPEFHSAMDELKSAGRVRFLGVCNHGTRWASTLEPAMDKILLAGVEDGRFDVMLLVYNFVAHEMGERVLQACSEKDIGTTLMKTNPVGRFLELKSQAEALERDGKEVSPWLSGRIAKYKENADLADSFLKRHNLNDLNQVRDAAIGFALNNEKVHTVCLSFMNFDYVKAYLELSGRRFSETDGEMLAAFQDSCGKLYCRHACGVCELRCPRGVPVNRIMRYNHYFEAQGCEKYAMGKYANLQTSRADKCGDCKGYCEETCPYDVPIQTMLALAHRRLTLV